MTVTLAVPVKFASGVKVAVQVLPPSAVVRLLTVPPTTSRSLRSNPVTCSLKVKVTSLVSPAMIWLSTMLTSTLGPWVSVSALSLPPVPLLPARSV
ncbi:hypothetical protein D3C86_1981900 [compost metagenome]